MLAKNLPGFLTDFILGFPWEDWKIFKNYKVFQKIKNKDDSIHKAKGRQIKHYNIM